MQIDQSLPQFVEQVIDMARDNPIIAIGAVVAFLFLTSLLPASKRTRREKTYGGRPISYHLGRALGDIVRGRSRRG